MKNNYDFLANSSSKPQVGLAQGPSLRKTSMDLSSSSLSSLPQFKRQWGGGFSTTQAYPVEERVPRKDFSNTFTSPIQYRDLKKLPETKSSLRQTFDIRGNNRIREMISNYDDNNLSYNDGSNGYIPKNSESLKFDKLDHSYHSPK